MCVKEPTVPGKDPRSLADKMSFCLASLHGPRGVPTLFPPLATHLAEGRFLPAAHECSPQSLN